MSQAATQGLIPDLVPQEKRGLASGYVLLMAIFGVMFLMSSAAALMIRAPGAGNQRVK